MPCRLGEHRWHGTVERIGEPRHCMRLRPLHRAFKPTDHASLSASFPRLGVDSLFGDCPGSIGGALRLSDDGQRLIQYLLWESETAYIDVGTTPSRPPLLHPTVHGAHHPPGGPEFECRSPEQTEWLRHHGRRAHAAGTAKVLVVTPFDGELVVAYYAWSMASITIEDAPARVRRGAGRYPQRVALLARLGVTLDHEGRGLGAGLLADAFGRTAQLGVEIGCRGLLVHAETAEARDFYLHLVPEFEASPTDELHLFLLMKDIHKTLRS